MTIQERDHYRVIQKRIRTRKVRRDMILCMFSIVFVCFLGSMLISIQSNANSNTVYYKYYTEIVMYPGDSIENLISDYMDFHYKDTSAYLTEVCEINHIDLKQIHAGDTLVVPYFSTEFK